VAQLRAAGALLIGKANMHEIGVDPSGYNAHYGTIRNPYNPARPPRLRLATARSRSARTAAARAGKKPGERSWRRAPVLAYAEAVCEATNGYLARLTDDELDRRVSFFGRESSVGDVLARFVAHTASHAGEIAAVKGMQGLQGLPF
jgi:hypothetical protein